MGKKSRDRGDPRTFAPGQRGTPSSDAPGRSSSRSRTTKSGVERRGSSSSGAGGANPSGASSPREQDR